MKNFLMISLLLLAVVCIAPSVMAQSTAKTGPDASTVRDPEMEKDSLHNLEVAWQYFKLKKAYVAALARCEEIIAGNPTFSRMDKVLYVAGASSLRLSQKQGKQKNPKATPEELRDDAREYLSRLTKDFPESEFRDEAEKELRTLDLAKKTVTQKSGARSQESEEQNIRRKRSQPIILDSEF